MTVKVEMERDENKKLIALAFECSNPDETDILEAVRLAILGDTDKKGGYLTSNRFVVHVKEAV